MGHPKQLLKYQGRTLIYHAVSTAVNSVCEPIIVVLGANADLIRPEIASFPVTMVLNRDWQRGMSTSIRIGLETLLNINPHSDTVVLMLCDQPYVSTALINQLVEIYYTTKQPIIASQYGEIFGVPALFARSIFPLLTSLEGDQGARQIIKKSLSMVVPVNFPLAAMDIDTPNDYSDLSRQG